MSKRRIIRVDRTRGQALDIFIDDFYGQDLYVTDTAEEREEKKKKEKTSSPVDRRSKEGGLIHTEGYDSQEKSYLGCSLFLSAAL